MKPVLYVVANKSLQMSAGKLAAQVGHAVAGVMATHRHPAWLAEPHRWMIVLSADDAMQLWNLHQYLEDRNVFSYPVIDEGVNEISPFSLTALGVEILDKDSLAAAYFEGLALYRDDRENPPPDEYLNRRGRRWRKLGYSRSNM